MKESNNAISLLQGAAIPPPDKGGWQRRGGVRKGAGVLERKKTTRLSHRLHPGDARRDAGSIAMGRGRVHSNPKQCFRSSKHNITPSLFLSQTPQRASIGLSSCQGEVPFLT